MVSNDRCGHVESTGGLQSNSRNEITFNFTARLGLYHSACALMASKLV